jgi:nucleoside-diphosphate-sugar epimerase
MHKQKTAVVCGDGGFIGGQLVRRLKEERCWVRGVDLKRSEFSLSSADEFIPGDLRKPVVCRATVDGSIDEVYQPAADMGGRVHVYRGS